MALLGLAGWLAAPSPSRACVLASEPNRSFRVYLPAWLPTGFKQIHDPNAARYATDARRFFMRRYGAQGRWVEVFEGPAGCCLDNLPSHRVGVTRLPGGRVAYLSDQGKAYGGLLLFWDQGHTYIVLGTPNLSRNILVRIAASTAPKSSGACAERCRRAVHRRHRQALPQHIRAR